VKFSAREIKAEKNVRSAKKINVSVAITSSRVHGASEIARPFHDSREAG